jgi:hypothetical protein
VALPPILALPAGTPHAHLQFRISLSSVSSGLQLSPVENQAQGDPRRHHRHQCQQCVGVAVPAEIRLLVRLTSSFGDRFGLHYVSRMECDWCTSIYGQGGSHNLNMVSLRLAGSDVYDVSILKPSSAVSARIYNISSILLHSLVYSMQHGNASS